MTQLSKIKYISIRGCRFNSGSGYITVYHFHQNYELTRI